MTVEWKAAAESAAVQHSASSQVRSDGVWIKRQRLLVAELLRRLTEIGVPVFASEIESQSPSAGEPGYGGIVRFTIEGVRFSLRPAPWFGNGGRAPDAHDYELDAGIVCPRCRSVYSQRRLGGMFSNGGAMADLGVVISMGNLCRCTGSPWSQA